MQACKQEVLFSRAPLLPLSVPDAGWQPQRRWTGVRAPGTQWVREGPRLEGEGILGKLSGTGKCDGLNSSSDQ